VFCISSETKLLQNKAISDNIDPVLSLQGVGWLLRKALGVATVTQSLRQNFTTGQDGKTVAQITIDQFVTGGLKGTTENRILDWQYRGHSDWLFGTLQGKSRYTTLKTIVEDNKGKGVVEEDSKFLSEGWLKETEESEVVESFVDNEDAKWTGWQIWGFTEKDGERRLARSFAIRRKDKNEVVRVRLFYDWAGDLE
jgi:hypothetical protein